jgi:hypothetical protein
MRVLCSGMLVGTPHQGGATWAVLQWVLGLRSLGHEVTVVEQLAGPVTAAQRAYAATVERQTGVAAVLFAGEAGELARRTGPVDLVVNLSGVLRDEALLSLAPARLYVDLDPGFTQVWHASGADVGLRGHTAHATVGLCVGTRGSAVPTVGLPWLPVLPPVVLDRWTPGPVPQPTATGMATSVGHWRSYGSLDWAGVRYGQRAHSARRLLEVPARSPLPVRFALGISDRETADLELLDRAGWTLVDPAVVAGTPDDYRSFVRGSAVELGIAKSGYVAARTGWFSDRSACYLAAGRPVVAQDTGWSGALPTGDGLHAYDDADGAVAALEHVVASPARASAAACELARAHLDARLVLGRLLEAVT